MQKQHVLVVGLSSPEFLQLAPSLADDGYEIDRLVWAPPALALVAEVPFGVLLLRYPLPGMEVFCFLDNVRRHGSPCRPAKVILVAEGEDATTARRFIGRGANRVLAFDEAARELRRLLTAGGEAPRAGVRLAARLVAPGQSEPLACRTENVSITGMRLATERRFSDGTELGVKLTLPDCGVAEGRVEVVRGTTYGHDRTDGIGVRFISLPADSRDRLDSYLKRHLVPPPAPRMSARARAAAVR